MQFFIGVIPPDEYSNKIIQFQKLWNHNEITDIAEPHITVKAQGGLSSDINWLERVRLVCKQFPPFTMTLKEPAFFGDFVLYLAVDSIEIYDLHKKLVEAISPSEELIKSYFELDNYSAHLTLGQANFGLSNTDLKDMASQVETKLKPYPTFEVNFIRIYQEIESNKYRKYLDIPLNRK